MRVFVTGATGFVGRALIPRLQRDGHAVVAWVRSPARARGLLGAEVELVHTDTAPDGLVGAIERSDAVVNLAGAPLMGGRWTAARGPLRAPGAPVRVRLSDLGLGARGHCRGHRRRDLARAVETRRSRGGSLRTAGQDGDRCPARSNVRLLLESREPRRDHAGCDAIFHSGTAAADGGGRRDRLSRARRSSTSSLAHPHHHVGAGPKLCRSSREGPVPLLVAQSHISGRWPAHGDGGSRVLHTAAWGLRAAGESRLHPLDTQEDLSVSRRCDPPPIRSVVAWQLRLPPSPRSAARLVFTAHSIAVAMAGAAVSRAAPGVVVVGGRPARNSRLGAGVPEPLPPAGGSLARTEHLPVPAGGAGSQPPCGGDLSDGFVLR